MRTDTQYLKPTPFIAQSLGLWKVPFIDNFACLASVGRTRQYQRLSLENSGLTQVLMYFGHIH